VLLAIYVVSPILRLLTYRAWADANPRDYFVAVGFAAALAAVTWGLVRATSWPGAVLPWIAALGVLIPGDVVHYQRLAAGPATTLDRVIVDDFSMAEADGKPAAARWLTDGGAGASVRVENGEVVIDDPLGVPGYLDMRIPPIPTAGEFGMTRPLGLYRNRYTETLEFDVAAQRSGDYLVLFDGNDMAIQISRYGLHVTYRNADRTRSDADIDSAAANDGQRHRYRLERTWTYFAIAVDGQRIFAVDSGAVWGFLRFGETRPDAVHGGQLRLDNVHYLRRYYAD
jgi:hypothetical protein